MSESGEPRTLNFGVVPATAAFETLADFSHIMSRKANLIAAAVAAIYHLPALQRRKKEATAAAAAAAGRQDK